MQHAERLGKVLGLLHLSNETKEGDVRAVREDDVGNGGERVVQVGLGGDVDVAALELDTDGDHGDQDGGEDADKGRNGNVGHVLDGPGQGQNHADDHTHDTKDDGAGTVVGDGVHHGGERDDMAPHDEDGEEQLTKAEQLTAKATHDDLASIREVVDVRVTRTELANGVTGVERDDTETDDDDDGAGRSVFGQQTARGGLTAPSQWQPEWLATRGHPARQIPQS